MILSIARRPCVAGGRTILRHFGLITIYFHPTRHHSSDHPKIWDPWDLERALRAPPSQDGHFSPSPPSSQSPDNAESAAGERRWLSPGEPPLNSEQAALVDLVLQGENVFYTGAAGTGKSRVLKEFVDQLRLRGKNVQVVAPTGRAALAVGGITTWSFMGWTPAAHARPLDDLRHRASRKKQNRTRLADTDVLVIDEISMVENHHLQRVNEVMKEARWLAAHVEATQLKKSHPDRKRLIMKSKRIRELAFGGCQVITTGDFCQLPPVLPFKHCIQCGAEMKAKETVDYLGALTGGFKIATTYECPNGHGTWKDDDKWAFRSKAWKEARFKHVELHQVHRQAGDPRFIEILKKVRMGEPPSKEDVQLMSGSERNQESINVLETAVRLFPTRAEVYDFNEAKFQALPTQPRHYPAMDQFIWNIKAHPRLQGLGKELPDGTLEAIGDDRFEPLIQLKEGMPVVLLSNLDIDAGLVNGSQGVVCGWEPAGLKNLSMRYSSGQTKSDSGFIKAVKDAQTRAYREKREGIKYWPIVHFFRDNTKRVIYPDCWVQELGNEGLPPAAASDGKDDKNRPKPSLLCRTQIPLMAAWAMTIHKAQGMTLGSVVVDLSRAFAEGQVYVALSRARSIDGLRIEGDPRGLTVGRGGNKEVRAFYKDNFGQQLQDETTSRFFKEMFGWDTSRGTGGRLFPLGSDVDSQAQDRVEVGTNEKHGGKEVEAPGQSAFSYERGQLTLSFARDELPPSRLRQGEEDKSLRLRLREARSKLTDEMKGRRGKHTDHAQGTRVVPELRKALAAGGEGG